jgi:hypothetical protein
METTIPGTHGICEQEVVDVFLKLLYVKSDVMVRTNRFVTSSNPYPYISPSNLRQSDILVNKLARLKKMFV